MGGGRPKLCVSLSKSFLVSFPVGKDERFDLLLGTGDKKGLLRLRRNAAGILQARIGKKGGASFHCGFIERFGAEPAEKEFCNASVIDADTVEVVLPAWED